MELNVTLKRVARIWWSHLWKSIIIEGIAVMLGIMLCMPIGYVLNLIGAPAVLIALMTVPLFLLICVGATIIPMWLILGGKFGDFRLVLLDTRKPE